MKIDISLCPTWLEGSGEVMVADSVLQAVTYAVEADYPDALVSVQIGYRQGDEWFKIDGVDSRDDLYPIVNGLDWSDETLYAYSETD